MSKTIFYIIIGIFLVSFSAFLSNNITARRASVLYNQLEARYISLEKSNTKLQYENSILVSNNKRLTEIQQRDAELISSGQGIIREFQVGIGESFSTIDRIEKGISALEQLIIIFTEQNKVLENSNSDNG